MLQTKLSDRSKVAIMEAKQILEKSKELQKATAAGESPSGILGILNELKTGVVPSEDLLRSTKIGVVVNKSKSSKNPEIARLANEIVRKWRDEIQKQKGSSTPQHRASPVPNGKPASTNVPTPEGSPATTTNGSKSTVPPDQRDYKKDKVDTKRTNQATRDNCIGLFYNGLCYNSTESPNSVLTCAVACEQATFDAFGPEDKEQYKAKVRSLFQNLKNKSNAKLRINVLNGEIPPDRFVHMSNDELKSAERKAEDMKMMKENLRDAQVPQAEKSISTSLQCGKCGERKVSYSQAQTRSADEPMTTFCECTVCGKRWKVSHDAFRFLAMIEMLTAKIVFLSSEIKRPFTIQGAAKGAHD